MIIALIEGHYFPDFQVFSQANQGGIGVIRGGIMILFHFGGVDLSLGRFRTSPNIPIAVLRCGIMIRMEGEHS